MKKNIFSDGMTWNELGLIAIIGIILLGGVILLTSTASGAEPQVTPYAERLAAALNQQPVIPKLKTFNGTAFKNFAEFRVQISKFSNTGVIRLEGDPFEQLINCNSILKVHRFEDGNSTDYSCLMFLDHGERGVLPVLVREEYDTILKRMKKAMESR